MNPLARLARQSLKTPAVDDCPPDLKAALSEAWMTGARAWPGVTVPFKPFVLYVAKRVRGDLDAFAELRSLHVADLYLACACAAGDSDAIAAFERTFFDPIGQVFGRRGIPMSTIDEAKQVLRIQFFVGLDDSQRRITSYAGRGELKHWVQAAVARVALKLQGAPRVVADQAVLEELADPRQDFELDFLKRTYREDFDIALREAFESLAVRDRSLLRYYFLRGLSIDQLGAIYRVHRSTAARRIRSVNEQLIARTRDNLAVRLGITGTDVSSILRLVRSQIERSVRSLLVSGEAED